MLRKPCQPLPSHWCLSGRARLNMQLRFISLPTPCGGMVYACSCVMNMRSCSYVCTCVCMLKPGQHWIPVILHLIFEAVSHCTWRSLFWLDQLASTPQGSSLPHRPSIGRCSLPHPTFHEDVDLRLGRHFTTKLSSQTPGFVFERKQVGYTGGVWRKARKEKNNVIVLIFFKNLFGHIACLSTCVKYV